jgi:hypothetical protein
MTGKYEIDSDDAEKVVSLLVRQCWNCNDSGKRLDGSDCHACDGKGGSLTRAGEELVSILEQQGFLRGTLRARENQA